MVLNSHFRSNLKANKTDKSLWSPHLVETTRYENELFEEIKRDPDLGLRPIVDAAVQSAFRTTQITKHAVSNAALSPSYVESKLIEPPFGDLVKAGVQTCLKRRKLLPNKGKPYSGEAEAAYALHMPFSEVSDDPEISSWGYNFSSGNETWQAGKSIFFEVKISHENPNCG